MKLNEMQKAVLRDYADGQFAYLIDTDLTAWKHHEIFDDMLLIFILMELSDNEDCENVDMGTDRLTCAKDDIDVALQALEKLQEAIAAKIEEQG